MRRRKSLLSTLVAAVLVLGFTFLWRELRPPQPERVPEERLCVRVIDGDTIELDGAERVRLIGVDTPESVDQSRPVEYFGKEASAFTRGLAEGKRVRLEFDRETVDTYGRTLAYVYLPDRTLLNGEIIRRGYGHAYTRFPFRYEREFVVLEREARAAGRGLWAR